MEFQVSSVLATMDGIAVSPALSFYPAPYAQPFAQSASQLGDAFIDGFRVAGA